MNKREFLLDCPVDTINQETALSLVSSAISKRQNYHIITINPEMIMNAQNNPDFLDIINNSDLNIPDGVGVKIALKMKGVNCLNIRGVDFARRLIAFANEKNIPIGFIGAKEEVIQAACNNFVQEYPNLNIVYKRNGYFKNFEEIIPEIKSANPKILLVGLGSPKQEELIYKLKNNLEGCTMIGVGGSFDVLSGTVKEAPLIYRKMGIEWLYRTICQPERIKRIFPALPLFLLKCIIRK